MDYLRAVWAKAFWVNFGEPPKGEVRGFALPRTRVHRDPCPSSRYKERDVTGLLLRCAIPRRWADSGTGKVRRRRLWTSPLARQRTRSTGRGTKWPQSPRSVLFLPRPACLRSAYLSRVSPEAGVCLSDLEVRSVPFSLPCPSLGPSQPQQAYLGAAASSTTSAQAPSTVRMLRLLDVCTAIDAPRRSPPGGGLFLRRPATGRPAAAV
jgi:hypothetical protein